MKQKLLLFILPMLFFATLSYSQQVWDFGGADLSGQGYTNMIVDNNREADLYANGAIAATGDANSGNTVKSFSLDGIVSWLSTGSDRIRTNNSVMTRYDVNLSPAPTYDNDPAIKGCVYANATGSETSRALVLSLTAGDNYTVIVASNSTSGSTNGTFNIKDPNGTIKTIVGGVDIAYALHINAPSTGDYTLYDSTSKMRVYRVYASNVSGETNISDQDFLLGTNDLKSPVSSNIKAVGNRIYVTNVKTSTEVNIYSITGALVKTVKTNTDTDFSFRTGLWIATVKTDEGQKAVKLLTH